MSACNTAGGGADSAEALSGLARAFFYAGARALLVSHWAVNSYAAAMLTSHTFAELKREPTIGRSESFRRAMLALIDDEKRPWAGAPLRVGAVRGGGGGRRCSIPPPAVGAPAQGRHPAMGGPFALVGEGASAMPPSLTTTQGVTSPATPSVAPSKGPARPKPKPSTQKGDWKATIWKGSGP